MILFLADHTEYSWHTMLTEDERVIEGKRQLGRRA